MSAFAHFRVDGDGSVVLVDNVLDDIEADARAGLIVLCLKEGLEDAFEVVVADAHAIVGHGDAEMLTVGLYVAGEAHFIFGVFAGIGEQVAHYLGDGLAVDDGGEVLVGVGHGEMLAAILEGGCEAHAHILYQLVDVLGGKVHDEALLLYLAEVEQLVDQFEQPVGVAVDDLHLFRRSAAFHDFLQGRDDERYGRAYLVGNHREEVEAGIAHLFLFLLVQPLHLELMAVFGAAQTQVDIIPDGCSQQQQIEELGIPAPPERRLDDDAEPGLVGGPDTVVVGGLHAEEISARGQVGVGGLVLVAHIVPVAVEALEHIGILVFLWRAVAQRGKRQCHHARIAVAKRQFLGL